MQISGTRLCRNFLRILAVAGIATAFLTTGCSMREAICGSNQYPVKAVGNKTGGACQDKGKEPPAGYVRFPEGKVPRYVDDEWDRYWHTVIVDSNGNIVSSPPTPAAT